MNRTIMILLPSSTLDHHLSFSLNGITNGSNERLNTHGPYQNTKYESLRDKYIVYIVLTRIVVVI